MEPFESNVDGYYDVEGQLPRYLRRLAREQFEAAERDRAGLDSPEAVRARRRRAKSYFFESFGGLPNGGERTPLNPTRTGRLDRDGYAVERVVFESLPDFHVTTTLYLPTDRDGSVPGVLLFCGHSDLGKAAGVYQRVCIDLVTNGFAVLAVDPLGQGERHQFYDPATDTCPRTNTAEHTYLGHQCQYAGTNLARYFVWDCIRAFDYLAERPEVDADRIAATGNSGGGMQTGYLMLADDRLAAAAPCCFVTAKEDYVKTGQAQDGEQILYRAIERGPRYDDFVSTFAPKPVLVGSAQSDFLCIEGAHRTYERAKAAYAQFDATDAVDLAVSPTTHGFTPHLREAVVNWFRVHLREETPTFQTGDPDPESPEALRCLDGGEVNAAYPEERHVVDFTRAYVANQSTDTNHAVDPDRLRARVRDRFDLDRDACRRFPRVVETERRNGLVWEKLFFRSESDVVVTGILARRPEGATAERPVEPTVALLDRGTDELSAHEQDVADLARDCGAALVFDPRGVGGVRARDVNTPLANGGDYYDTHGTEYKLASDALMLGTSLVALRTFDVLQVLDYLRGRFGGDEHGYASGDDAERDAGGDGAPDVGLVGAGTGAVHALYAGVADASVASVVVDAVPSFRERATTEEVAVDPGLLIHDAVDALDTPQLLAALAERGVDVRRGAFSGDDA